MTHYINGIDFYELEAMKYYAYPTSWTPERQKNDTMNLIFTGDWYGSQKRDGFFMKFLKDEDGVITFTGRSKSVSGDYLNKWEWVPQLHEWGATVPNGTCFIGEIYWPHNEGSKNTTSIMNCLKDKAIARQKEEQNKLHYYIFDCLAYDTISLINVPALRRFQQVMDLSINNTIPYVEFAHYVNGAELWDTLQDLLANGYEGMVITHKDAKYEPGKRPSKTTRKLKQSLAETIDCVIIGANAPTVSYTGKEPENWQFWQDVNTGEKLLGDHYKQYYLGEPIQPITKAYYYGWAGSLRIGLYKDGEMVYFGDVSGITDEVKEHWKDYVGKVCEIGGMQLFQDGEHIAVRHPRLLSWRADKPASECTWDQLNQ